MTHASIGALEDTSRIGTSLRSSSPATLLPTGLEDEDFKQQLCEAAGGSKLAECPEDKISKA